MWTIGAAVTVLDRSGVNIICMPVPSDDTSEWLARLDSAPGDTVRSLVKRVCADADQLPPRHMLRVGDQHYSRAQLRAIEVQLRSLGTASENLSFARAYITDAAVIDTAKD
jgi:hypothetical protein